MVGTGDAAELLGKGIDFLPHDGLFSIRHIGGVFQVHIVGDTAGQLVAGLAERLLAAHQTGDLATDMGQVAVQCVALLLVALLQGGKGVLPMLNHGFDLLNLPVVLKALGKMVAGKELV